MEEEKLTKRVHRPTKKRSCLARICLCLQTKDDESENNDNDNNSLFKIESKLSLGTVGDDQTIKPSRKSSTCTMDYVPAAAEVSVLHQNALYRKKRSSKKGDVEKSEKLESVNKERIEPVAQRSPFTQSSSLNFENKEKARVLVKTILSKYLEMKTATEVNNNICNTPKTEGSRATSIIQLIEPLRDHNETNSSNENCFSSETDQNSEDKSKPVIIKSTESIQLKVSINGKKPNPDSSTESSSKTILPESFSTKLEKPAGDFPAKTKSAPTNSTAHDSLADICTKFSRFKLKSQDFQSETNETYYTSEDETANYKNKLQLVFNKSSEDIFSNDDDNNSGITLQYTISCERTPVVKGISRENRILHSKYESSYDYMREVSRSSTFTSRELRVQPSARGELNVNGYTDSTTSLKWKLIISHHKDMK